MVIKLLAGVAALALIWRRFGAQIENTINSPTVVIVPGAAALSIPAMLGAGPGAAATQPARLNSFGPNTVQAPGAPSPYFF